MPPGEAGGLLNAYSLTHLLNHVHAPTTNFGRIWASFGQSSSNVAQMLPKSAKRWPQLVEIGETAHERYSASGESFSSNFGVSLGRIFGDRRGCLEHVLRSPLAPPPPCPGLLSRRSPPASFSLSLSHSLAFVLSLLSLSLSRSLCRADVRLEETTAADKVTRTHNAKRCSTHIFMRASPTRQGARARARRANTQSKRLSQCLIG